MAKLIRFDLPMNGKKLKGIDELSDNMTVEILGHYKTGLLANWLRVRGNIKELTALEQIVAGDDAALLKEICAIFDVEVDDFIVAALLEPAKPFDGSTIGRGDSEDGLLERLSEVSTIVKGYFQVLEGEATTIIKKWRGNNEN
jgi:hypothetical protein